MITHTILEGDVMDGLRSLQDNSVQMCVTSPPYYGLRNYGVDGQIGLEKTPEEFIQKMVEVFREVRRVLREDGTCWLNLGDSYAGSGCGSNDHREEGASISKNDQKYQGQRPGMPEGLKAKDLMGIPWRVAFALQSDGWCLRSAMPWIKRNCMPESTTDRPTSAIEYIFLLTKSGRYYYDGEAIRVDAACPGDDRKGRAKEDHKRAPDALKNGIRPRKQDLTGNPTYTGFNERWKGKHSNQGAQEAGHRVLDNVKRAREETGSHDQPFGQTRNYRNSDPFFESWQGLYQEQGEPLAFVINPQSRPELHFATFPDLLAETCIKAGTSEYGCCPKCGAPYRRIVEASGGKIGESWHPHSDDEVTGQVGFKDDGSYRRVFKGWQPGCDCNAGEPIPCVVLDPFMGSGTVAVVARNLNRSSIGCELNPEYVRIIKKRLDAGSQLDTGLVAYEFRKVPA